MTDKRGSGLRVGYSASRERTASAARDRRRSLAPQEPYTARACYIVEHLAGIFHAVEQLSALLAWRAPFPHRSNLLLGDRGTRVQRFCEAGKFKRQIDVMGLDFRQGQVSPMPPT
jgi:hypothetical protein